MRLRPQYRQPPSPLPTGRSHWQVTLDRLGEVLVIEIELGRPERSYYVERGEEDPEEFGHAAAWHSGRLTAYMRRHKPHSSN